MRNSIIAVLAVVLLAHASGGSVQTACAQQAAVHRTPLCSIALHDRVGVVIERDEAQTYRLFTTLASFRSAQIFRDLDTVAWACVEREGTLPDTLVRFSDPLLVSMAQKIDQWVLLQRGAPFNQNLPPAMRVGAPLGDAERERIHRARAHGPRPRLDATPVAASPPAARDTVAAARKDSADTVRPRWVRTVKRAHDPDILPFAWTVVDPGIPRTYLFAIGLGYAGQAFPKSGSLNAQLVQLEMGLSVERFDEMSFSARGFLPWDFTIGVESGERVADMFVRYELPVIGSTRVFAGIGLGKTEYLVENAKSVVRIASSGLLLHAGVFVPMEMLAIEASANYCDAPVQNCVYSKRPSYGSTPADQMVVRFDPSRTSLRLQVFIMF